MHPPFLLLVLLSLIIVCLHLISPNVWTLYKELKVEVHIKKELSPAHRGLKTDTSSRKYIRNGKSSSGFQREENKLVNRTINSHSLSTSTIKNKSLKVKDIKNFESMNENYVKIKNNTIKHMRKETDKLKNYYMDKKPYVVGSMTTTPKRLKEIKGPFGETLKTLLNHEILNKIYLNIPWVYDIRNKSENITLSVDLLKFVSNSKGRLVVLRCIDYGPSTKLLPLLSLSNHELPLDTMIITFDDDRLYRYWDYTFICTYVCMYASMFI